MSPSASCRASVRGSRPCWWRLNDSRESVGDDGHLAAARHDQVVAALLEVCSPCEERTADNALSGGFYPSDARRWPLSSQSGRLTWAVVRCRVCRWSRAVWPGGGCGG